MTLQGANIQVWFQNATNNWQIVRFIVVPFLEWYADVLSPVSYEMKWPEKGTGPIHFHVFKTLILDLSE